MPQQLLQGQQFDASFEEVGGVAVPQGVHRRPFVKPGGTHGPAADLLGGGNAQVVAGLRAGEEPGVWPVPPPVVTQKFEQPGGEGDETVLATLGVAEVQEAAGAVDVGDLEADDLGDAQAAGVGDSEQQAVACAGQGVEEALGLLQAEDGGQRARLLAVGKALDEVGSAEGDGVEEAAGRDALVEDTPGDLLLQEVKLEDTELVGGELIGGEAEVFGEADQGGEVSLDGVRRVVAELQVVEEALTQRSHGNILVRRPGAGDWEKDARGTGKAQVGKRTNCSGKRPAAEGRTRKGEPRGKGERRGDQTGLSSTAQRFSSTPGYGT
jgi:hypothetical protein